MKASKAIAFSIPLISMGMSSLGHAATIVGVT